MDNSTRSSNPRGKAPDGTEASANLEESFPRGSRLAKSGDGAWSCVGKGIGEISKEEEEEGKRCGE